MIYKVTALTLQLHPSVPKAGLDELYKRIDGEFNKFTIEQIAQIKFYRLMKAYDFPDDSIRFKKPLSTMFWSMFSGILLQKLKLDESKDAIGNITSHNKLVIMSNTLPELNMWIQSAMTNTSTTVLVRHNAAEALKELHEHFMRYSEILEIRKILARTDLQSRYAKLAEEPNVALSPLEELIHYLTNQVTLLEAGTVDFGQWVSFDGDSSPDKFNESEFLKFIDNCRLADHEKLPSTARELEMCQLFSAALQHHVGGVLMEVNPSANIKAATKTLNTGEATLLVSDTEVAHYATPPFNKLFPQAAAHVTQGIKYFGRKLSTKATFRRYQNHEDYVRHLDYSDMLEEMGLTQTKLAFEHHSLKDFGKDSCTKTVYLYKLSLMGCQDEIDTAIDDTLRHLVKIEYLNRTLPKNDNSSVQQLVYKLNEVLDGDPKLKAVINEIISNLFKDNYQIQADLDIKEKEYLLALKDHLQTPNISLNLHDTQPTKPFLLNRLEKRSSKVINIPKCIKSLGVSIEELGSNYNEIINKIDAALKLIIKDELESEEDLETIEKNIIARISAYTKTLLWAYQGIDDDIQLLLLNTSKNTKLHPLKPVILNLIEALMQGNSPAAINEDLDSIEKRLEWLQISTSKLIEKARYKMVLMEINSTATIKDMQETLIPILEDPSQLDEWNKEEEHIHRLEEKSTLTKPNSVREQIKESLAYLTYLQDITLTFIAGKHIILLPAITLLTTALNQISTDELKTWNTFLQDDDAPQQLLAILRRFNQVACNLSIELPSFDPEPDETLYTKLLKQFIETIITTEKQNEAIAQQAVHSRNTEKTYSCSRQLGNVTTITTNDIKSSGYGVSFQTLNNQIYCGCIKNIQKWTAYPALKSTNLPYDEIYIYWTNNVGHIIGIKKQPDGEHVDYLSTLIQQAKATNYEQHNTHRAVILSETLDITSQGCQAVVAEKKEKGAQVIITCKIQIHREVRFEVAIPKRLVENDTRIYIQAYNSGKSDFDQTYITSTIKDQTYHLCTSEERPGEAKQIPAYEIPYHIQIKLLGFAWTLNGPSITKMGLNIYSPTKSKTIPYEGIVCLILACLRELSCATDAQIQKIEKITRCSILDLIETFNKQLDRHMGTGLNFLDIPFDNTKSLKGIALYFILHILTQGEASRKEFEILLALLQNIQEESLDSALDQAALYQQVARSVRVTFEECSLFVPPYLINKITIAPTTPDDDSIIIKINHNNSLLEWKVLKSHLNQALEIAERNNTFVLYTIHYDDALNLELKAIDTLTLPPLPTLSEVLDQDDNRKKPTALTMPNEVDCMRNSQPTINVNVTCIGIHLKVLSISHHSIHIEYKEKLYVLQFGMCLSTENGESMELTLMLIDNDITLFNTSNILIKDQGLEQDIKKRNILTEDVLRLRPHRLHLQWRLEHTKYRAVCQITRGNNGFKFHKLRLLNLIKATSTLQVLCKPIEIEVEKTLLKMPDNQTTVTIGGNKHIKKIHITSVHNHLTLIEVSVFNGQQYVLTIANNIKRTANGVEIEKYKVNQGAQFEVCCYPLLNIITFQELTADTDKPSIQIWDIGRPRKMGHDNKIYLGVPTIVEKLAKYDYAPIEIKRMELLNKLRELGLPINLSLIEEVLTQYADTSSAESLVQRYMESQTTLPTPTKKTTEATAPTKPSIKDALVNKIQAAEFDVDTGLIEELLGHYPKASAQELFKKYGEALFG